MQKKQQCVYYSKVFILDNCMIIDQIPSRTDTLLCILGTEYMYTICINEYMHGSHEDACVNAIVSHVNFNMRIHSFLWIPHLIQMFAPSRCYIII